VRRFRALLRKEWRDHRTLALVAAVLVAAGLSGVHQLFGDAVDSEMRTRWLMPAGLALFLAAVAADSAARETNDGVGDALGRLPIGARTVCASKLVFLTLAGIGFQSWLVTLEMIVRQIIPEKAPASLWHPELWAWTAASTGAVFAFAVMLRRSFPGAILGLGTVIGIPLAWNLLPADSLRDWLLVGIDPWSPVWMAIVVGLAFVLASFAAYSPWCAPGNDWTRRVFPALGGLCLVLAPAVGASSVWARRVVNFEPYHGNSWLLADASPDGRFVAIEVGRDFRSTWRQIGDGTSYMGASQQLSEVWVLDRSNGSLHTIDGRTRRAFRPAHYGSDTRFFAWIPGPWGADGMLRTWSSVGPFMRGELGRLEVVDPSNGSIVSQVSALESGDHSTFESEMGLPLWYERLQVGGDSVRIRWREREDSHTLLEDDLLAISPEPGVIFHADESGNLVRRNLGTGSVRTLTDLTENLRRVWVSPNGRSLFITTRQSRAILDSSSGEPRLQAMDHSVSWPTWSRSPGRVCYVHLEGGLFVVEESGGERRLDVPSWVRQVSDLGDDLLLARERPDGDRLAALDLEGHLVEILYETEE